MTLFFHGGVPGVPVGGLLEGGHTRDNHHPGCKVCEARAKGTSPIDRASERPDQVYFTEDLEYARFHASLYGKGDLYRVEPVGPVERSAEDLFPSFTAPQARVVAVLHRRVLLLLSPRQRLTLYVRWGRLSGVPKRQALAEFARLVNQMGGAP